MRSGSRECQTIESQSVSRTSSRPPGRSTRRASASAPGMSARTRRPASRRGVEARVGERHASASARRLRRGAPGGGGARARARACSAGSTPWTLTARTDHAAISAREQPGAGADVEHVLARLSRSASRTGRRCSTTSGGRVDGLQPARPGVVELEHRLRSAAPPARRGPTASFAQVIPGSTVKPRTSRSRSRCRRSRSRGRRAWRSGDALGDQLGVLDEVRRRVDDAGDQDLALGQLDVLEDLPLVLVARVGAPRTRWPPAAP